MENHSDAEAKFRQSVLHCGSTGDIIKLPDELDRATCGRIMAEVAAIFIDRGEDIKAIIILEERRRLGV